MSRVNATLNAFGQLTRRNWKRIEKIDNQIKDALHQQTDPVVLLVTF